ncbi:MAG: hypothetical protein EA377_00605 [Phycisphaerales bacterium]|nr:MAG: hypothetical protein EA377_00605 [Phycisphaerales bacterium]
MTELCRSPRIGKGDTARARSVRTVDQNTVADGDHDARGLSHGTYSSRDRNLCECRAGSIGSVRRTIQSGGYSAKTMARLCTTTKDEIRKLPALLRITTLPSHGTRWQASFKLSPVQESMFPPEEDLNVLHAFIVTIALAASSHTTTQSTAHELHTMGQFSPSVEYRFDPGEKALVSLAGFSESTATRVRAKDAEIDRINSASESALPFGEAGHRRWSVQASYGVDLKRSRNQQITAGLGLSFFVIDTVSLDFEFNGMYFDQRGDNAWAPNFAMLLRWHALMEERWSLYLEGGAGLMYASNKVPFNGSKFNFTPQAGGGISFEINDQARLFLGARWHHISNANTQRQNPGRDSVIGYVAVSFPF